MTDIVKYSATPEIVEALQKRVVFTPDISMLKKYDNIPIFIYDDMKRDKKENRILKGSKYLGRGKTCTRNYKMNIYYKPIVFIEKETDYKAGYIKGEVFSVSVEKILELDRVMLNGLSFIRMVRNIILTDQEYTTSSGKRNPVVPCHMYIGDPDWWKDFNPHTMQPRYVMGPSYGSHVSQKYYEYLAG